MRRDGREGFCWFCSWCPFFVRQKDPIITGTVLVFYALRIVYFSHQVFCLDFQKPSQRCFCNLRHSGLSAWFFFFSLFDNNVCAIHFHCSIWVDRKLPEDAKIYYLNYRFRIMFVPVFNCLFLSRSDVRSPNAHINISCHDILCRH